VFGRSSLPAGIRAKGCVPAAKAERAIPDRGGAAP
jgi:hypothetical protein